MPKIPGKIETWQMVAPGKIESSLTTLFDIADGLEVDIVELLRDEMD